MKKLTYILASILLLFVFTTEVSADELVLSKNDTLIRVGDSFQVTVTLEDYEEDIQGIQGLINFDSNYLTLKSISNSIGWNYGNINVDNGKFMYAGGIDKKIAEDTNVFTLTFETKKEGSTKVQLKDLLASNGNLKVDLNKDSSNELAINIERALSRNANLGTLISSVGYFSPSFNADTTSYKLYVPYETTKVKIDGTVANEYAKATGFGEYAFYEGLKTVTIEVTAEYGNTKTYTVEIVRLKKLSNENKLDKVEIKDVDFKFDSEKTEYSITVPYDMTSLDITAIAKDLNAIVSIEGANDLKVGENTVTITVKAENGEEKVYTLKVTREAEKTGEETTPEENGNNNAKLLIIILIIVTILALAFLFLKKDKNKDKSKQA